MAFNRPRVPLPQNSARLLREAGAIMKTNASTETFVIPRRQGRQPGSTDSPPRQARRVEPPAMHPQEIVERPLDLAAHEPASRISAVTYRINVDSQIEGGIRVDRQLVSIDLETTYIVPRLLRTSQLQLPGYTSAEETARRQAIERYAIPMASFFNTGTPPIDGNPPGVNRSPTKLDAQVLPHGNIRAPSRH